MNTKNTIKTLCLLIFFYIASLLACQKEATDDINISLYDKSPDVIQPYIQGKWKVEYYEYGGFAPQTVYPTDITYWTFTDNRIRITQNGILTTDTTFSWQQVDGLYIMVGNGPFNGFNVSGITNNILYIGTLTNNGITLALLKVKQ